jgi:hypothetical protein
MKTRNGNGSIASRFEPRFCMKMIGQLEAFVALSAEIQSRYTLYSKWSEGRDGLKGMGNEKSLAPTRN